MHTATHVLVAAALFARPGRENRARNIAAVAGGFVPDLAMFAMFAWAKATRAPEYAIWREWYFNPPWQTWIDYSHSIPLYLLVLLCGWLWARHDPPRASIGRAVAVFALAALSHVALDLPVHIGDAHAHFVPFSTWRFHSPVSYWNRAHYGGVVQPVETLAGIALCLFLWLRFENRLARGLVTLALISYAAPTLSFGFFGRLA